MPQQMTQPTEEQIRTRAYYLWEADGRPQGRDWDYWMKAKSELAPTERPTTATAISTPKKAAALTTEAPKKRNSRQPVLA